MRIIFMGTPDFAVASLDILVKNDCNIVAVITAPDKPAGRGNQLKQSAVKEYAVEHRLPLLQPTNLKSEDFLQELKNLKADLQIVVAFRMLPEAVWAMPPLGTFNLHASLLPKYRGAAPINWAIMNGEKETGVTTFFLKHEIDTGNVIFQEKEPIHPTDNVGDLYERLMYKGANLVLKTVNAIEQDNYTTSVQEGEITHAPKIFKDTCEIDWNNSVQKIYDFVRGLSPYPTAWTNLTDKSCKIYKVNPHFVPAEEQSASIGGFITDQKTYLAFRASDGWVAVEELQLEGKKRMGIEDFLRGFKHN